MIELGGAHFVLVPGFWLGGWAWQRVAEELMAAGHSATAITLPGLQSVAADRAGIGIEHHAAAVAAVISRSPEPPILVAHSGAGAVVSVVLDRDPQSVRRVVYIDSGPAADGWVYDPTVPADAVEVPLPAWDDLSAAGASLDDLSPDDLEEFGRRAVPHPARVAREPVALHNEARRSVPTTVIACSIPADALRELAAEGHPMFAEVAELTDLTLLDLPTGHWPMLSKPHELAKALASTAEAGRA